jgi:hypothetical protein
VVLALPVLALLAFALPVPDCRFPGCRLLPCRFPCCVLGGPASALLIWAVDPGRIGFRAAGPGLLVLVGLAVASLVRGCWSWLAWLSRRWFGAVGLGWLGCRAAGTGCWLSSLIDTPLLLGRPS